ncbi:hypothetical protein DKX38_018784 [Salix brachista]|uniref:Uncharacterized protein n=1 Tax=Salix brachista TaxID=2182728 RepID=A0A5N5KNY6_9ROSI|nr:hypothetical protein DKX38_018784 [Salix brachista]
MRGVRKERGVNRGRGRWCNGRYRLGFKVNGCILGWAWTCRVVDWLRVSSRSNISVLSSALLAQVWPETECPFRPFSLFLSISPVKLAAAMINAEEGGNEEEGNIADGMRSVQLLIACAEAVACRDKSLASALLSELRSNALVFGSVFQRVASCLVQGLIYRLSLVQPLGAVSFVATTMNIMDIASDKKEEEALRLVYEICPHIRCSHFVANNAILEAFEGESSVHVVAAAHPKPRRTCWKATQSPSNNRFLSGEEQLGKLDLKTSTSEGGALVVNSILQLHCVVKESRGALNSVLQIIHELSQKIAKMEQFYFAEEVMNTVSCEGPARVERHERVDQWRRRMSRAGFQAAPIKMMAQAKQWLVKNPVCDGYTVVEEKGCLAGNQNL